MRGIDKRAGAAAWTIRPVDVGLPIAAQRSSTTISIGIHRSQGLPDAVAQPLAQERQRRPSPPCVASRGRPIGGRPDAFGRVRARW